MSDIVNRYIRPQIRSLAAYSVPPGGEHIKLDAMENPYTWPDRLVDAWLERLRSVSLNRYPDPTARRLKQRLRTAMGIPADMGILLGNGSDELIQIVATALAEPGRIVLAPEPTFVMYRMITTLVGMNYISVPLESTGFQIDTAGMLESLEAFDPCLVFLAYPNNPTGNLFDEGSIHQIIKQANGLVVIDEAYAPFANATFMGTLGKHENLLVLRTASKMGFAGLRFGYLIGPHDWLEEFNKVRLPYNINSLTLASMEFVMEHREVFDEQVKRICRDRQNLFEELLALDGIQPYPSDANFILFRVGPGRARELHQGLLDDGILIKHMAGNGPLEDFLRVTVGRPHENRAFMEALKGAL